MEGKEDEGRATPEGKEEETPDQREGTWMNDLKKKKKNGKA